MRLIKSIHTIAIQFLTVGFVLIVLSHPAWASWPHTWGGTSSDSADSVAVDAQGNLYVAGSTSSFGAGGDVLIVKYSPAGTVLWSKTWGGSANEFAAAVAIGPDGYTYVTGGTSSFGAGWFDFFILKLDTGGNLQWGTTWGGGSYDVSHDLGFDSAGNIYVVGETYSFGPCCSSSVLMKFSPNGGPPTWTASWKGPATYDAGYSLTVDSNFNVIVAGISWDYSVFPNHNSLLLIKYDASGNYVWSENWSSPSGQDESWSFRALTTDSAGNIYVGGRHANQCLSGDFSQCNFDVLTLKFNSSGNFQWANTWGGSGYDTAASVAVDADGQLLVSGIEDVFGTPMLFVLSYDSAAGSLLSATGWSQGTISAGLNLAGMVLDNLGNAFVVIAAQNNTGAWALTSASTAVLPNSLVSNPYSLGAPVAPTTNLTTPTTSQTGVIDTGGGGNDVFVSSLFNQTAACATEQTLKLVVNGHKLTSNQDTWVRFVGNTVVLQLLGPRGHRVLVAARASWWGLKEGTFSLANPHAFSSCSVLQPNGQSKDIVLGPLETCASGRAWQVGLAAIQVPNFSEQEVMDTAAAIWPNRAITEVLADAADLAGFNPTRGTGAKIVGSTGVLRKSWLLRHPVVGLTLVEHNVTDECIDAASPFCYGTGWQETRLFAPTRAAARGAVDDLRCIYTALAPP